MIYEKISVVKAGNYYTVEITTDNGYFYKNFRLKKDATRDAQFIRESLKRGGNPKFMLEHQKYKWMNK